MANGKARKEWLTQLEVGQAGEIILDNFLEEVYFEKLEPATQDWQNLGIDRFAFNGNYCTPIEYKTDFRAAKTGNLFLEIVKNSNTGAPGWACTTFAQVIYYYIPPLGTLLELWPTWKLFPGALETFKRGICRDELYDSEGILFPMKYLNGKFVRRSAEWDRAPKYETEKELISAALELVGELPGEAGRQK